MIESLEGVEVGDRLKLFTKTCKLDYQIVLPLAESLSTLIWELAKMSSNLAAVSGVLANMFPQDVARVITKV